MLLHSSSDNGLIVNKTKTKQIVMGNRFLLGVLGSSFSISLITVITNAYLENDMLFVKELLVSQNSVESDWLYSLINK